MLAWWAQWCRARWGPGPADGDSRRTRDHGRARRGRRVRDDGMQRPGSRPTASTDGERQPAHLRRTRIGRLRGTRLRRIGDLPQRRRGPHLPHRTDLAQHRTCRTRPPQLTQTVDLQPGSGQCRRSRRDAPDPYAMHENGFEHRMSAEPANRQRRTWACVRTHRWRRLRTARRRWRECGRGR